MNDGSGTGELPEGHRSGFVTIFGRSNVGKSTLMNRLVGSKVAIVTDVPQTTRRRVRGIRTYDDVQVVYMDTPGVHKPRYAMNRRMVATAIASLDGVDLVLLLVDAGDGLGRGDEFVMDVARERVVPVFLIINKVDLITHDKLLVLIGEATAQRSFAEVVPVSALKGDNVQRLESLIRKKLPPGPRYFPEGTLTDAPEKFLMAEILREKIILNTRQELPHATAVVIERQEEGANGILEMDALMFVDRESQKGILIGKGGATMKKIASQARHEMEERLGTKVFLQTWVKVARDWRMDPRILDQMGVEGEIREDSPPAKPSRKKRSRPTRSR
ncbi:MAG: GTPase Era [Acidobacteria bacterium]|nr:MAG: GTPase Era [Acidobacteriota bacterium]